MNLLKWIHKNGNRTTAAHADAAKTQDCSPHGNGIEREWRSAWSPDDSGFRETRRHVGQSAEGFHAGIEVSRRVSERITWSEAFATPEQARKGATEMERRRREEIEAAPAGSESGLSLIGD